MKFIKRLVCFFRGDHYPIDLTTLKCKICGKQHDPTIKRGRLYVDHCHHTGAVRSLLCQQCNIGMGNLKDDPEILEKAAAYIRSFRK